MAESFVVSTFQKREGFITDSIWIRFCDRMSFGKKVIVVERINRVKNILCMRGGRSEVAKAGLK
jgi:hypothetical protein